MQQPQAQTTKDRLNSSTTSFVTPKYTKPGRLNNSIQGTTKSNTSVVKSTPKPLANRTNTSRLNNSALNTSTSKLNTSSVSKPTTRSNTPITRGGLKNKANEEKKKQEEAQEAQDRLNEQLDSLNKLNEELRLNNTQAEAERVEANKQHNTLRGQYSESQRIQQQQELELSSMKRTLKNSEEQIFELKSTNKHLEHKISMDASHHKMAIEALNVEHESNVRSIKQAHQVNLEEERDIAHKLLQSTREELQRDLNRTRGELERTKIDLNFSVDLAEARLQTIEQHSKTIEKLMADIKDLETKRNMDEESRRKLHNALQELKGNIRVYCRVRPLGSNPSDLITSEGEEPDFKAVSFNDADVDQKTIDIASQITNNQGTELKKFQFQFDKVFRPEAQQKDVFVEISQLVQSALDGYKVCIFAYGQTGSGKTFTMEGPPKKSIKNMSKEEEMDQRGMIPRSVEQIFECANTKSERGWKYTVEASFLEIYNESIRDLLVKNASNNPLEADNTKYEIKHDNQGNTNVSNLTYVPVKKPEDVHDLLSIASKNRAAAATSCNERSSRSHAVFALRIVGHNEMTEQTTYGVLNLIDLAGSERLNNSKSTGARLKETQHINSSLSCLGDVISALASKSKHVPYRNSKLTYLLQNCLGGEAKTLMFVNVSPKSSHSNETVCSLRFASKVNSCDVGTATRKIK
ncbi:kinesin family protein [Acrasis kona]|uniref:Kinesin-like protein n=1 Tax=Acrasis kona TaxID=1008807 RepID=A0AAW2Z8U5_9EUKA